MGWESSRHEGVREVMTTIKSAGRRWRVRVIVRVIESILTLTGRKGDHSNDTKAGNDSVPGTAVANIAGWERSI